MMVRNFQNDELKTSGVQFLEGDDAVAQNIRYRLRLFLGEYFLDVTEGTPWYQSILGKAPQDVAEVNLKQRIVSTPGVRGIERFTFSTDRDQRSITVNLTARTDTGETITVQEST